MIGADWGGSPPSAVVSHHPHQIPSPGSAVTDFNWSDVKGVYKNCRGIWAAQWTDEKGQRHTKYFNPKFYANEATAKYEAYKFKVHIQKEIELKGGVQKRRATNSGQALGGLAGVNKRKGKKDEIVGDVGRRIRRAGVSLGGGPQLMENTNNPSQMYGPPMYAQAPPPMRYAYGSMITPDLVALFQSLSPSGLRSEDKSSLQWQPSDYFSSMPPQSHDLYQDTGSGCKLQLGPIERGHHQHQQEYYSGFYYNPAAPPPQPMGPQDRADMIGQACERLSWGESSSTSSNGDESTVDTVVNMAPHMWPYEPLWGGAPRNHLISALYPSAIVDDASPPSGI